MCVGSSHAYTALRADYQEQLTKVHDELGIKYVRFHGLFDDEMSVCIENFDFTGKSQGITYNFVNIDKIYDFLLKIGMKPFVELILCQLAWLQKRIKSFLMVAITLCQNLIRPGKN